MGAQSHASRNTSTSTAPAAAVGTNPRTGRGNAAAASALAEREDEGLDGGVAGPADAGPIAGVEGPGMTSEEEGPTCGTDVQAGEDEAERQAYNDFVCATHTATNASLDGYGNFDLSYNPATSRVEVTVRIQFDFQCGPVGDMIASLFNDDELADYVWSDDEERQFSENFVREVSAVWSEAASFRCTKDDGTLASPKWSELAAAVTVRPVVVEENPHYNVVVERIPTGRFSTSEVTRPERDASGNVTEAGSANFDSNDLTGVHKRSGTAGSTQRAVAHEFGHMLGNQDEYTSASRPEGTMTRQGLPADSTDNDNIMAGGEIVQQAHYESIKRALNTACSPVTWDFA